MTPGNQDAAPDFRELSDRVYRLCLAMLRDATPARDAAQEALVRGWARRASRREGVSWWTWFGGFAVRVCREFRRGRAREAERAAGTETLEAVEAEREATEPAPAALPMTRIVRDAVMRLPDRQREVTVLRYFVGASTAEAAELLGCPEGTIKSNLHKALASLHAALTECGIEDELSGVSASFDRGGGG
ncbi:MAG: ECF RNA polymerase sigma factor SigW [Phycisphaerae bacterium]|nr:ECF RNA polymerase sigma factor SigW [Phycisphaerae bacterium]